MSENAIWDEDKVIEMYREALKFASGQKVPIPAASRTFALFSYDLHAAWIRKDMNMVHAVCDSYKKRIAGQNDLTASEAKT